MRNLCAFIGAAILTFAGLGWYLDWYKVKSDPAPAGHHNVNIDINREKITEDVQKGEEKLQGVLEKEKKKTEEKSQQAGHPVPGFGQPVPVPNE